MKKAGATAERRTLTAAARLAPATWTGADGEAPPDPPVALGLDGLPMPVVAVAFEPPVDGDAEGIEGSYFSQTAPSANGHCRIQSQHQMITLRGENDP